MAATPTTCFHYTIHGQGPLPGHALDEMEACGTCGMECYAREFHPFTACVLFLNLRNPETVREHLHRVIEWARSTKSHAEHPHDGI